MKMYGGAFKALVVCMLVLVLVAGCSTKTKSSGGNASEMESPTPQNKTEEVATEEPKKENITLKVMFQKRDGQKDYLHDWMQENIKLYKEKNSNVSFEVIANTCCDNYLTVVTTEMAANNVPDIFQGWTLERMRPFAEAGRLYDMSEAINADAEWKSNLSEDALKGTTFNDKVYGLPLAQDAEVIYYNKEVFAKYGLSVPQTYDDFLNIIEVLAKNGVTPMTVPNKEPWVGSIPYMMILERIGGLEAYQETVLEKTGSWANEPFIEAGKVLQELMNLGAFEKNVNSVTTKEAEVKLAEGKAGMYAMGTWSIATLTGSMGENLGFFNFPDISGGKGSKDHYLLLPNSALSVGGNSKYPEEAMAFLKFVFSQERQLEFAKLGYLTAYKTKTSPGDLSKFNEEILASLNEATGTMYPWDVPLGVFMGKELNNTTQSLYTGANPKEAFEKLQQTAESQKK